MTCNTSNPGTFNTGAPAMSDPCDALPYLRAAYYQLLAGQATASIGDADRRRTFHQGDTARLQQEIARLEAMCPKSAANPHGGAGGGSTSARNRVLAARGY